MFRKLLAEGALNGAFVPMWLRLRSGDGARAFAEQIFGVMLVTLGSCALLCAAFAPAIIHLVAPGFAESSERFLFAVTFLRWSIGYVTVAGLASVAVAILNAEGRVASAAGSIAVFNTILVGAVLLVLVLGAGESLRSGIVLTASFTLGGIAQLALLVFALFRLANAPRRLRFGLSSDAKRFFARAIPAVIASGVPALTFIAGTIIASSSTAAVSWLYYAYRLYELPLGIVTVAVASVLTPRIAASVHVGDSEIKSGTQSRAFEIALGLSLPAAIGLALLAEPIAGVLFERGAFAAADTIAVAAALFAISVGLPGHALERVFAATCFAHEDTRTPMLTGLISLGIGVIAAILLSARFGHVGIAAGIASTGWISSFLLAITSLRRGWLHPAQELGRRLGGIVISSIIMGIALAACLCLAEHLFSAIYSTPVRLILLIVLMPLGIGIYFTGLRLFGVIRIGELLNAARQRI